LLNEKLIGTVLDKSTPADVVVASNVTTNVSKGDQSNETSIGKEYDPLIHVTDLGVKISIFLLIKETKIGGGYKYTIGVSSVLSK
jgi:hypothetical protein